MNWLMGRLNMEELAKTTSTRSIISSKIRRLDRLSDHQCTAARRNAAAPAPEIAADLERAGRIMKKIAGIDALYKLVAIAAKKTPGNDHVRRRDARLGASAAQRRGWLLIWSVEEPCRLRRRPKQDEPR